MTPVNQEVTGFLMRRGTQGVLVDTIITPKVTPREGHIVFQAHPQPENTEKYGRDELKEEINNIKPPTFDGEHKKEEDVETWLLGMKKYFQLQNYSSYVEGRIAMYQLKERGHLEGI